MTPCRTTGNKQENISSSRVTKYILLSTFLLFSVGRRIFFHLFLKTVWMAELHAVKELAGIFYPKYMENYPDM